MTNLGEHEKILTQIAELEKTGVNYFDVEKEFFLIDSDNLDTIKTRLYGYSIQATGIYEDDNLTEDAAKNFDGRGCYVYVEVRDGKITITQDMNGCWGIYLFRHGDYFALSNSFFRLVDHIKFRYPLTANRDYCHYLLVNGLCSHAYSETAINEIRQIERNAFLQIDAAKKTLDIDLIDYREHTVIVDSAEGVETLDRWLEFWCKVFRGVTHYTNLRFDLSGGFDTRISLIVLLNSGVDLKKVFFNSKNDKLHTHAEDYAIATQIAEHYGFNLNDKSFVVNLRTSTAQLNYSLADIFNIEFYALQTFHKHPYIALRKNLDKTYNVNGFGGETIRGNWLRYGTLKKFMNAQLGKTFQYSPTLSAELSRSVKNILESAFHDIGNKYGIKNPESLWLAQYLYQETRIRSHHGKTSLGNYFGNRFLLSPCFDPELRTLKFNTPQCPDSNLLMAMLFTRYEADLLKFPFEGKRSIAPETIAFAQKINERFPRRPITDKVDGEQFKFRSRFNFQLRDKTVEKILAAKQNNKTVPANLLEGGLKAMFDSSRTYGLFTTCFNAELYQYAATYYDTHNFGRIRYVNGVAGVAKVLEDVEISNANHPPYQDVRRFIEQDFCEIKRPPSQMSE